MSVPTTKSDYDFLMHTSFFDAITDEAKLRLTDLMSRVRISKGERFISQGLTGDCLYIIQQGECSVVMEREGLMHHVTVLGPGDIVGEMALLTGEARSAHVVAQTDMELWRLNWTDFDEACERFPEIRSFLTQVVSNRFARATFTAERTMGKYVIQDVIGRGGWSVVYKGVHSTLNMPVAIKMLKHDMAMDQSFLSRFRNEATTIAHLNHENIVKVYDIEEMYRTVFIIMELLEGTSVQELFRVAPRLSPEQGVDIILQTCSALAYAHSFGIVHGDIKPGNIFLQNTRRVKILDFGVASTAGTRSERLMGTPKYFSPEQIRMRPVDHRSDIYSLGLSAYRMLTGEEAFSEQHMAALFQMHLYEDVPDPRSLVPDLPPEIHFIISKATQKNPDERYQSIDELVHDLRSAARRMGMAVSGGSSRSGRGTSMMGLFLFYRDDHSEMVKRLVTDFTRELRKIGVELRESDFRSIG
jgi:CRP-like cAMP-binding protein